MKVNTQRQDSQLKSEFRWAIALGILLIVLGSIALIQPFFVTLAATLMFGWVWIVGGICRLIYAFDTRKSGQFLLKILLGGLYFIAGLILVINPFKGALTLTLILGIAIFINGVFETILAFQLRPAPNWGWVLISGFASIVLGILIGAQWPLNALWTIGLLVGINLIISGWWTISFSLAVRSALKSS